MLEDFSDVKHQKYEMRVVDGVKYVHIYDTWVEVQWLKSHLTGICEALGINKDHLNPISIGKHMDEKEIFEEWMGLPEEARKKILIVMSRISECSFRRGAQQVHDGLARGQIQLDGDNFEHLRFKEDIDVAPSVHTYDYREPRNYTDAETTWNRFLMEYGAELNRIGISTKYLTF